MKEMEVLFMDKNKVIVILGTAAFVTVGYVAGKKIIAFVKNHKKEKKSK